MIEKIIAIVVSYAGDIISVLNIAKKLVSRKSSVIIFGKGSSGSSEKGAVVDNILYTI
jgi:hypothetical protein